MSPDKIKEIMNKPIDEVKEMAVKEITNLGYVKELQESGIAATVNKINEDIKEKPAVQKRKVHKKKMIIEKTTE